MEKLVFDSGIRKYSIGEGVLRFNPTDPNVYARFMDAVEKIQAVEDNLVEQGRKLDAESPESGGAVVKLMAEADREIKKILSEVFGGENDFDRILGGVNLLAVGDNGERVVTNLLYALTPVMQEGAERCAQQQASAAVAQAKQNRAQRRAKK